MSTTPLVSIIIPVYKVEQYLRDTVKSVQDQTYENVEIVLVDDGSPDNSGAVCDELAQKDKRIKVVHQPNSGVTKARNHGISAATGAWIVFLDGDDQLLPNTIEYFVTTALTKNVDIVQTPNIRVTGDTRKIVPMTAKGTYDKKGYLSLLANGRITGGIGGKIIRKSLFDENTLDIPSGITNNEDMLMNIRLSRRLNSIYCNPRDGYYLYFERENSTTRRKTPVSNWDLLYKEYFSMIEEFGPVMNICLANSVYTRYLLEELSIEQSKDVIRKTRISISMPIYIWFIKMYFSFPNKLTKFMMNKSKGLYKRLKYMSI